MVVLQRCLHEMVLIDCFLHQPGLGSTFVTVLAIHPLCVFATFMAKLSAILTIYFKKFINFHEEVFKYSVFKIHFYLL